MVGSPVHIPADSAECDDRNLMRDLEIQAVAKVRGARAVRHAGIVCGRAALLALFLGVWTYAVGRWIDPQFLSTPLDVLIALFGLVTSGRLWPHLMQTLVEVLSGYSLGAIFGAILALIVGLWEPVHRVLRPYLIAVYSIPKIALAPLIIMWFGLGTAPKVILAASFVFFLVFMNTAAGMRSVSQSHINVLRVMGASKLALLWKIMLPSSAPFLITGLRLSIPDAMIGVVIGEFMASNVGLGYLVNSAAAQFNTAVSLAAIVALLCIVTALDFLLSVTERWLFRWRPHDGGVVAMVG